MTVAEQIIDDNVGEHWIHFRYPAFWFQITIMIMRAEDELRRKK